MTDIAFGSHRRVWLWGRMWRRCDDQRDCSFGVTLSTKGCRRAAGLAYLHCTIASCVGFSCSCWFLIPPPSTLQLAPSHNIRKALCFESPPEHHRTFSHVLKGALRQIMQCETTPSVGFRPKVFLCYASSHVACVIVHITAIWYYNIFFYFSHIKCSRKMLPMRITYRNALSWLHTALQIAILQVHIHWAHAEQT
jgi:hypothetical protein